ncbi:MAG: FG-GAP-like repeat-containing protein, partial [Bacteroidales bacterium]
MRNFFILFFFISIIVLSGCKEKGTAGKSVPSDLVSLRTLGLAYLEELKFDEAENTFKKFIQLSPEDKFGYANLGLTYMRMGRFEEAKQELARAIKIDPDDADIRLIMATTYQMNNEREKAIQELENTYSFATGHVKILYSLAELYSSIESEDARREYKKYTSELLKYAPENLIPYMNLIEISIKEGDFDRTIELLEKVIKQFPEFPPEAREYYEKTLKCLRKKDRNEAQVNFTVFHNYIKVTKPYQAGMVDLKGPGGSFIGFPLITFSSQTSFQAAEGMPQAEVKFTDATLTAGLSELKQNDNQEINVRQLSVHIATCDFDNDGDIDIYAGIPGNKTVSSRHFLFVNETGRYENVTNEYGIKHAGKEISSVFADYDNDGFTDLLITKNDGIILYRNAEKGLFRDVSSGALPRVPDGASKALFLDADHEGDLDLLLLCNNGLKFFRNNGNGTFTDQSAESGIESLKAVSDAVFGDFDEDGDIDIILASENESNVFLANQRQSFFKNNTKEAGLESTGGDRAIASGDYNNDGFLDIFIGSVKGNNRLYINQKNGTFK